jgi:hypothetical protein
VQPYSLNVENFEGTWEICDPNQLVKLDQFLEDVGYPWFIRQFLKHVSSRLEATHCEEQLGFFPVGKFLGCTVSNFQNKIPPMVFRNQPTLNEPKHRLRERNNTGNSFVAKLGYRFANVHLQAFKDGCDGCCFAESICFDPKQVFNAVTTLQQVFDMDGMGRWVEHLRDVNVTTGLPKAMLKAHWNRFECRMKLDQRDGKDFLELRSNVYEFDPWVRDWSRLRASTEVLFTRVPKEGGGGGGA